jgi:hypothetical protein
MMEKFKTLLISILYLFISILLYKLGFHDGNILFFILSILTLAVLFMEILHKD